MTALKGAAVDRFLERPDRNVVLLYGPDTGLVAERAAQLIAAHLKDDTLGRIVLDGDALAGDPGRLADEAHAVPMFGGRQAIRVAVGAKSIDRAVAALVDNPPRGTLVVIEAGDLKKSAPLRKLAETADSVAVLPCYADDEAAIDRLITREAEAAGLAVAPEARAALRHILGSDRMASRGELEKLMLYCGDAETVELADVEAICGDASALTLDAIADAAFVGDTARAETGLRKAAAAGVAPAAVAAYFARHLMQLMVAREKVEAGATADAAMRALRPQVFYKRQPAFRRQLSLWTIAALGRVLPNIARAELDTRLRPDIADEIMSRLVISIATATRRGGR